MNGLCIQKLFVLLTEKYLFVCDAFSVQWIKYKAADCLAYTNSNQSGGNTLWIWDSAQKKVVHNISMANQKMVKFVVTENNVYIMCTGPFTHAHTTYSIHVYIREKPRKSV